MVYHDKDYHVQPSRTVRAIMGGLAGMLSTIAMHPLDLIKVRLQLNKFQCTPLEMMRKVVRCEGYRALYSGFSAALMRQATYTTTRLGSYYWLYENYKRIYEKKPSLSQKVAIGVCAGAAGAFAGNPSEIALIRIMADAKPDPCCRQTTYKRKYRGVFHAFYKISTNEGIKTLWRGGTLTTTRSVFMSSSQISSYSEIYDSLQKREMANGIPLHLYTSAMSSFLAAIVTLPIDAVKTRYQVSTDVTLKEICDEIIETKGVKYFWKGFVPYFFRLFTYTALTYMLIDEYIEMYSNIKRKEID